MSFYVWYHRNCKFGIANWNFPFQYGTPVLRFDPALCWVTGWVLGVGWKHADQQFTEWEKWEMMNYGLKKVVFFQTVILSTGRTRHMCSSCWIQTEQKYKKSNLNSFLIRSYVRFSVYSGSLDIQSRAATFKRLQGNKTNWGQWMKVLKAS